MTTITPTRPAEQPAQELPPLTAADRMALAVGTRLILRTERHRVRRSEQAARAEQARTARARASVEAADHSTFEHRASAGPTW